MKKIWLGTTLLAMMSSGCAIEDWITGDVEQKFTLSATHGMASRTALSGNETHWSEGDEIYVSSADGSVWGILELESGNGSSSAVFSGYINGDASKLAYTIFPAPKNGDKIDLSNRDAGNGELDAPMIATFGDDKQNVAFKNETALVSLPISGLSANETVILSGKGIGGKLVPYNNNGTWELVYDGSDAGQITIENVATGNLLIPIATSQNDKTKIGTAGDTEKVTLNVTIGESTIPVGEITVGNGKVANENEVPSIYIEDGKAVVEVNTPEKLKAAVAAGGDIKLTGDITLNDRLVIESGNTININLNQKTLTTAGSETQTTGIESKGNLTITNGGINSLRFAVWAREGTLNLIDCDVTVTGGYRANAVLIDGDVVANIHGGSYMSTGQLSNGQATDWYGIGITDGDVTLNTNVGGTFHGGVSIAANKTNGKWPNVSIEGGSYSGEKFYGFVMNGGDLTLTSECSFEGNAGELWINTFSGKVNEATIGENAGVYTLENLMKKVEEILGSSKSNE